VGRVSAVFESMNLDSDTRRHADASAHLLAGYLRWAARYVPEKESTFSLVKEPASPVTEDATHNNALKVKIQVSTYSASILELLWRACNLSLDEDRKDLKALLALGPEGLVSAASMRTFTLFKQIDGSKTGEGTVATDEMWSKIIDRELPEWSITFQPASFQGVDSFDMSEAFFWVWLQKINKNEDIASAQPLVHTVILELEIPQLYWLVIEESLL
jgi:hypothetical protein